jgi:hypothetical protein
VKTIKVEHTCGRVYNNRSASAKWISTKIIDKMKVARKVTVGEIIDEVRVNFSTGITTWRGWKARQIAQGIVEGDASMQFNKLYRWSAELRRVDPGNTCVFALDPPAGGVVPPRFQRFYLCLQGCKRGFLQGCRPFIGLDGCHLKTQYGGILLCAVGRDPNDQYFPFAFAAVESENKESGKWFLELLLKDLGNRRFVFISDQQKVSEV